MSVTSPFTGLPVIVGGGLAGLMTALHLAPRPVIVITPAPLGFEASSVWAQGGVAASVGPDDDAEQHLVDTLAAGNGLCDVEAARRILGAAPEAIATLAAIGTRFDRDAGGALRLGLEAAHGRRRIVHASGDSTGREIMRAVIAAVRACPSITLLEGVDARRILVEDGAVAGLLAARGDEPLRIATRQIVLATGGLGGLFLRTTNPASCFGLGLAMAARAGAVLADLEFVQFHPTGLDAPGTPTALISEAVRGEGARLVDETGRRFMTDIPGAELAPRDVVARAIWATLAEGHQTYLDARGLVAGGFARHFPTATELCQVHGIDPDREPIPVRPAAHYHMGGIAVDAEGHSSVEGLWACGEVARTGLHGANRLASNSLLEAAVCARMVARSLDAISPRQAAALRDEPLPLRADPRPVQAIISKAAGVLRDGDGLCAGIEALLPIAKGDSAAADPALIAVMIAMAALERRESRGAHFRTDCPDHATPPLPSALMTMDGALRAAEALAVPVAA